MSDSIGGGIAKYRLMGALSPTGLEISCLYNFSIFLHSLKHSGTSPCYAFV